MNLERFDLILRIRIFVSAIAFAIFIGVGFHAAIVGWLSDNPTPAVVLLVIAFLACPRRVLPKNWEAQTEEDRKLREERKHQERRLQKVRLFYFFVAFFLLALLPFFLGEPVFRMT